MSIYKWALWVMLNILHIMAYIINSASLSILGWIEDVMPQHQRDMDMGKAAIKEIKAVMKEVKKRRCSAVIRDMEGLRDE